MGSWLKTSVLLVIIAAGTCSVLFDALDKLAQSEGVTVSMQAPELPSITFMPHEKHFDVDLNDLDALKKPPAQHAHFYTRESASNDVEPKSTLYAIADFYGLPKELLYAQYLKETHGDCSARSAKHAVGCFQFLSSTARQFGLIGIRGGKSFDYRSSLAASGDAAARYLLWLAHVMYGEQMSLGNWDQLTHVLAAYNAGLARVKKNGGEPRVPSFFETQSYVHDIVRLAKGESYFVSSGETLSEISVKLKVSEEELMQGNPHLTTVESLYHGMVLSVPDHVTKESEVIVRPRMSLSQISRGTGIPINELMKANALKTPQIRTGMVLKLPVDKSLLAL